MFSADLSRALHLAFDKRQVHDYGEMVEIDADSANRTIADATVFVTTLEAYLESQALI